RPRWRNAAPAGLPHPSAQRPRRPNMDRARTAGAAGPGGGRSGTHPRRHCGGALRGRARALVLVLAAAVACGRLGPDLDRVVAISVADVPDSLEELDTLRPIGVALDGRGDPVPATILWATFDTALLTVVNDTTGVMVARAGSATPARIQASVGDLTSNPIAIRMLAAADTLFAAGPLPDSAVVTAAARRAIGTAVPGSPITFVVRFLP